MSLIEKAVQRLDQLKQAGAEVDRFGVDAGCVPEETSDAVAVSSAAAAAPVRKRSAPAPESPVHEATVPPGAPVSRRVDIDFEVLARQGLVTPDQPKSMLAEQFRVVKRPLILNARGSTAAPIENANLVMITSALPREGKSFSAINLAISMAMELDFTVLLVDADVARPSVLERLGLPAEKGLMDVLVGAVPDLSDVILRTNIDKLALLPAGMPHPRATELLASDAMAKMLDDMSRRYPDRIIVFDSPPLLATTEARVLATHMGQVVIVVEAERTTHAAVRQALATIEACPVKLMLLNKSSAGERGGLYGYGYGHGYGYGADSRTDAAA